MFEAEPGGSRRSSAKLQRSRTKTDKIFFCDTVGSSTKSYVCHRPSVFLDMYYVYILRSEKLNRTYVGHTNDVQRRLIEHNGATEPATAKGRPWRVATYIAFDTRPKAFAFERYLKSHSGRAFMAKRLL